MDCYLISYDIPDDRRRNKVAALLEGYGQRVQFSVFEVWLNDRQRRELLTQLEKRIKPSEDSVRVYFLCAACRQRVQTLGQGKPPQPPGAIII